MLVGRCLMFPEIAPRVEIRRPGASAGRRCLKSGRSFFSILGVIGSLMSGIVTPTEAGAYGAFLAYLIAFVQGRLTWTVFKASVLEAVTSTSRLLFVAVGAILLTKFLALSGLPFYLADLMGDWALDPLLLVIGALDRLSGARHVPRSARHHADHDPDLRADVREARPRSGLVRRHCW